ncbi:MAG: NAD(P)-binding domain-containing protein, partial [Gillisia sp.]|nr:NAD(P)-binding domain-containing protein [Gillisia sp.]
MISIVLFGTGNLATHLFKAILKAEKFKVVQVYNHKPENLEIFKDKTNTTTNLAEVFPADIYLFALKDDEIPALTKKLNYKNALVLHTSGATPMSVFSSFERFGV